jgi:hypothetical protein
VDIVEGGSLVEAVQDCELVIHLSGQFFDIVCQGCGDSEPVLQVYQCFVDIGDEQLLAE